LPINSHINDNGRKFRVGEATERAETLASAPLSSPDVDESASRSRTFFRQTVFADDCTHAQYTTAQIVNMLQQSGIGKLPDTMLILMARQAAL